MDGQKPDENLPVTDKNDVWRAAIVQVAPVIGNNITTTSNEMQTSTEEGDQNTHSTKSDAHMKDGWESDSELAATILADDGDVSLASNNKRLDPLSQKLYDEAQEEKRKAAAIAASCHQTQETQETTTNVKETAMVIDDDSNPPPQLKDYNMKIVFPKGQNSKKQMTTFVSKMHDKEERLTIRAFDSQKSLKFMRLLIAEDLPKDQAQFDQYLVPAWDQKNQDGTTVVLRVSTEHSHPTWKRILQKEIKSQKLQIRLHQLESLEMKVVGILLRKIPSETHLGCFAEYIETMSGKETMKVELFRVYPSAKVKTDAVGMRTNRSEASEIDTMLQKMFPIMSKGTVYVSYVQELSENQ